jgi:hypothetical protein
MEDNKKQ